LSPLFKVTRVNHPLAHCSICQNGQGGSEAKDQVIKDMVQFLPLQALINKFDTRINVNDPRSSGGLTEQEAQARLERDGPNELTPPKEPSEILRLPL
jgi:hypothetical protein